MTVAPVSAVRFAIRPARVSDAPFLFGSFLRSMRESDQTEGLGNDAYYTHYKVEFESVLRHFIVSVAHPEGDEDEIAGWIAFKARVIAWAYVKKTPWRGMGVARLLYEHAGRPTWALYASGRVLRWVREKGINVEMVPHTEAVRLLLGAAT